MAGCIFREESVQLFEAQFERLKKASGVDTDTAFASFLGLRQGSISGAKKKKQLPHAWFFQVAEKTGVSSDWLFWGRGPMQLPSESELADELKGKVELSDAPLPTSSVGKNLAKLEHELDLEREERRELAAETRRLYREKENLHREKEQLLREKEELLRENGTLREKLARLEAERGKRHSVQDDDEGDYPSLFDERRSIASSNPLPRAHK